MNGRPVWLASVSKRDKRGALVPNTRWHSPEKTKAVALLQRLTFKVGDVFLGWRLFRMNITYCLHVALADVEVKRLPPTWAKFGGPTALAGGPVEILDSGNTAARESVKPCHHPTKQTIPGQPIFNPDPDLWLPIDCGTCPPCIDRLAIESGLII